VFLVGPSMRGYIHLVCVSFSHVNLVCDDLAVRPRLEAARVERSTNHKSSRGPKRSRSSWRWRLSHRFRVWLASLSHETVKARFVAVPSTFGAAAHAGPCSSVCGTLVRRGSSEYRAMTVTWRHLWTSTREAGRPYASVMALLNLVAAFCFVLSFCWNALTSSGVLDCSVPLKVC